MTDTLSIITICFNNLPDLKETFNSVDHQTRHPYEHIIIDGSTNDDILHWLEHNEQPAYRTWLHERDEGIADAFNKGIQRAKGTITHLLNSGDKYYGSNAVEEVLRHFEQDHLVMWTHSLYIQHRGEADVISGAPFNKDLLWKGMRTVAHPTMFVKKEVYDRRGLYNLKYKIAMDYDLLIRIREERYKFINKPLIYFSPGGASNTQFEKSLKEVRNSYREHIGRSYKQTLWQFRQRMLHKIMQTTVGKIWFRLKNRKKITTQ
jgi:glycosyltransferase involved in cell wall biosynthesis